MRLLASLETLEHDNRFLHYELEDLRQQPPCPLPPSLRSPLGCRSTAGVAASSSLYDELSGVGRLAVQNTNPPPMRRLLSPLQTVRADEVCVSSRSGVPVPDRRNRVLVLGDATSRGVATGLSVLTDGLCIYGEIRPGFSVLQMASRIFQLSRDFETSDSVIVCLTVDSRGTSPELKHLKRLCSIGKYINLIFTLTYTKSSFKNYLKFVYAIQYFVNHQSASITYIDNTVINGILRLPVRSLCRNLLNYVNAGHLLRKVFTMFYVSCYEGKGAGIKSSSDGMIRSSDCDLLGLENPLVGDMTRSHCVLDPRNGILNTSEFNSNIIDYDDNFLDQMSVQDRVR